MTVEAKLNAFYNKIADEENRETFKHALGFKTTKMFIKVRWNDKIPYDFLREIIDYKREIRKEDTSFWMPKEE
ncbi:hypothetical protein GCM10007358_10910 [Phocicoccus schoeneichii]|uniref:Uncharacterized protein n=1 Tax=Phocicoccus schoeneichii TaxID=1812261 RepID=A0A6V7RCE3_9BACL|nr:hypothetical protein [Jeotgalicoccus schoeneichii]GGH52502.1 hypothetical protein GCM10007358_10910 [Jeotgalicoccus schoeneichii]CAD2074575.1 hypothetical protein JEOSCH030_00732 [Jeotgalicoccus schoeneichii]